MTKTHPSESDPGSDLSPKSQEFVGPTVTNWNLLVGSSRDFSFALPQLEGTYRNHLKGHLYNHHQKRSQAELPRRCFCSRNFILDVSSAIFWAQNPFKVVCHIIKQKIKMRRQTNRMCDTPVPLFPTFWWCIHGSVVLWSFGHLVGLNCSSPSSTHLPSTYGPRCIGDIPEILVHRRI